MEYNIPSGPFSDYLTFENPLEGKVVLTKALDFAIIIIIIIIIIVTRPKPAYGRQGLAGLWGQDTDEVSTFLVF